MIPAVDTLPLHATVTAPTTIRCVETLEDFTALRSEWNELLQASAADGPFLTWEWLHPWWTHLHGSGSLRLLVVREGSALVAVAPLSVARGVLGFPRAEFLGLGDAGSDYLDVIVRRGCEAESIRAIGGYLRSHKLALRLDHVPVDSVASALAQQLAGQGWTASTLPGGVCPFIQLAGHSWDSYLATLGSSHRANVRRRIKGLTQGFDTRFDRVETDSERWEALAALIAFHARRWNEKDERGSTAFRSPELRTFHDEATQHALAAGWLRLYTLRVKGAIAGVMYGFIYNGRFYFYQHGFDEQYKPQSVGLVLMALTIRAAIEEGVAEFDMLWGLETYKQLWAREQRLLQQIHLFPTHLGGRIHHRAVVARRSLGRLARRVLSTGDPCAA